MVNVLDIHFVDTPKTIAVFLVETSDGPVLFESGPHSALSGLEKELSKFNYSLKDIKHLFLTHIHLDHAGAAWALAQNGTKVYVHPLGHRHLQDPSRLYNSAKRIYGDQMEYLWGKMEGIPQGQLLQLLDRQSIQIGNHTIEAIHTPGHAVHHIAYKINDILIAGDVAGCKIENGPVVPPCPPPDINIEEWCASIDLLLKENLKGMYLTHFDFVEDVDLHMEELKNILWDWANFIKPYFLKQEDPIKVTPIFAEYAKEQLVDHGLSQSLISKYEKANPAWMSVAGLYRYWAKKLSS